MFFGRSHVLVQAVMDNVHFAADAPLGRLNAVRQVNDLGIRLIELDIKRVQNRVPKPGNIICGRAHKLVERAKPVSFIELVPILLSTICARPGTPRNFAAVFKLCHSPLLDLYSITDHL